MPKVEKTSLGVNKDMNQLKIGYMFECPGCGLDHCFYISGHNQRWSFNGNVDSPTFNPSLLVRWTKRKKKMVCHSFVRNGKIQFLNDCTHKLAGKTVELPEVR